MGGPFFGFRGVKFRSGAAGAGRSCVMGRAFGGCPCCICEVLRALVCIALWPFFAFFCSFFALRAISEHAVQCGWPPLVPPGLAFGRPCYMRQHRAPPRRRFFFAAATALEDAHMRARVWCSWWLGVPSFNGQAEYQRDHVFFAVIFFQNR